MSNRQPSRQRPLPNACLGKGCLKIVGILAGGFALLLLFAFCSDSSKNRKDKARLGTLEGRVAVAAENAFGKEDVVSIELTPQEDGGQRVHATFKGNFYASSGIGRKAALLEVHSFLSKFYSYGSTREASSFWFSPQSTLVDSYGKKEESNVGKLVIDREVTDKVSDWKNLTPEMLERLFQEEGTLWWHPAVEK